jgi:DNA polymerase-3 subunit gamma/tau
LDVWEAILAHDSTTGLECIHRTLDAGSDPRQFARQMVEYMRSLLMVRMGSADQVDAPPEVRALMARHAHSMEVPALLRIIQIFNRAAVEVKASWLPTLPLEIAFIESLEPPQPAPATAEPPPEPARQGARSRGRAAHKAAGPEPGPTVSSSSPEPEDPPVPMNPSEALRFDDLWRQSLASIRQANPNLYGLVNSAKTRRLVNGILTLGFSGNVLKEKMEKGDNIQSAQVIISQVFGESVTIRCEALTGRQSTPPPGVDNDGMVASALRDLGGEIVDIH